jgi:hypothetical protein
MAGEVIVDDGPLDVIGSRPAFGKRRTIMNAALKTVLCVVAVGYAPIVNGQVIFNPPRGTVEGDVRSSKADQQRAWGESMRNWGAGYNEYMKANQRRQKIECRDYEFHRQVEADRQEADRTKLVMRKERAAAKAKALDEAANRLVVAHQQGIQQWPLALQRPEYADSMTTIERVLKEYVPLQSATAKYARRALATEAALLQRRVAANGQIDFYQRVKAVRSLQLLQRAAFLTMQYPESQLANAD